MWYHKTSTPDTNHLQPPSLHTVDPTSDQAVHAVSGWIQNEPNSMHHWPHRQPTLFMHSLDTTWPSARTLKQPIKNASTYIRHNLRFLWGHHMQQSRAVMNTYVFPKRVYPLRSANTASVPQTPKQHNGPPLVFRVLLVVLSSATVVINFSNITMFSSDANMVFQVLLWSFKY